MTLLLFSTMFEIALLAKMFVVSDFIYHSIHMLLLIALLGSLLALYFTSNKSLSNRKYALLMATGMVFTTIGDYVNSAISNVNPVSLKLTWALLLFGIGYSIYVFAMWHCYRSRSKPLNGMRFERWYLLALPILVMNVISWFMHIQDYLYPFAVLHYGSFFFNATIYVLMRLGRYRHISRVTIQHHGLVDLIWRMLNSILRFNVIFDLVEGQSTCAQL